MPVIDTHHHFSRVLRAAFLTRAPITYEETTQAYLLFRKPALS